MYTQFPGVQIGQNLPAAALTRPVYSHMECGYTDVRFWTLTGLTRTKLNTGTQHYALDNRRQMAKPRTLPMAT